MLPVSELEDRLTALGYRHPSSPDQAVEALDHGALVLRGCRTEKDRTIVYQQQLLLDTNVLQSSEAWWIKAQLPLPVFCLAAQMHGPWRLFETFQETCYPQGYDVARLDKLKTGASQPWDDFQLWSECASVLQTLERSRARLESFRYFELCSDGSWLVFRDPLSREAKRRQGGLLRAFLAAVTDRELPSLRKLHDDIVQLLESLVGALEKRP